MKTKVVSEQISDDRAAVHYGNIQVDVIVVDGVITICIADNKGEEQTELVGMSFTLSNGRSSFNAYGKGIIL